MKKNLLAYTSLCYLTNAIVALYLGYYLYAFLFFILTLTSVVHHSFYHTYTGFVDRMAVLSIILYGAYVMYKKKEVGELLLYGLIVAAFLYGVWAYSYGFRCKRYCFDPDRSVSEWYHATLHVISSFGHHLIMLL